MNRQIISLMLAATFLTLAAPVFSAEEFPVPKGFTSGVETVDGIKIHYVKGGSGPLVYMVHGFGQSWYEWHQLMPELAKNHTVVAPDLPGMGQSEAPPSYRAIDVAPVLYKLAQRFANKLPFDLVSHDIGNWNTYPFAVQHQDAIRRMVFMEAPIPNESIYSFPAFTPEGESLVWHFSFFAAGGQLAEQLIRGREPLFLAHFIKEHATNQAAFTPELLEMYGRSYSKPRTLHASFEYYRVLNQGVQDNKVLSQKKITVPVLTIAGGGHGGMGDFQRENISQFASNVTSQVLPDCGHWLPEECPAALNMAVKNFLDAQ